MKDAELYDGGPETGLSSVSRKFCIAMATVALLPGFSSNLLAAEKLRVAFPALAPGLSPSWVTYEKGIWKKNGVDVELILLSGGSRTIAALVSGSVQVVIGSDVGVTEGILKGLNLIRLGVTTNSLGSSLLALQTIHSVEDLKGKTLGISLGRDNSYARLAKVLMDHGVNPNDDVKLLRIGGGEAGRRASLKAKIIQATMLFPPLDLVGSREGLKILLKLDVPTLAGGVNTSAAFLEQNRPLLVKFLRGYMEGLYYMATHKGESLKVFAKYFKNPDLATMAYLYDDIYPRIERELRPNPASVRYLLDIIALDDPRARQLSEKDH